MYGKDMKCTGLCLTQQWATSQTLGWIAYPCAKSQEDYADPRYGGHTEAEREMPLSFGDSLDEVHFHNFSIKFCLWDHENPWNPDHKWHYLAGYHDVFSLYDPRKMKVMAATLTKLEKGMEAWIDKNGKPMTPGHYMAAVCAVLGLKYIAIKRSAVSPYTPSEYQWLSPGRAAAGVNELIMGVGK